MINHVILVGRLGQDPEIRHTQNGDAVANFSVATSDKWKDKTSGEWKEKTEWHRCSAFSGLASVAEKFLQKGTLVYVEGKMRTRSYDKDGEKRYTTEITLGPTAVLRILADGRPRSDDAPAQKANDKKATAPDLDDEMPF